MATYTAGPDTYAGWTTGRNFGYFGLAAGLLAFASWAYLHGQMRGPNTLSAADQLFLFALEWVGGGLFVLMMLGMLGSIRLSAMSRGTITVDDVGVAREIGGQSQMLRWEEIEGFVVMLQGGIALIPMGDTARIEISRFLDDYRGCVAELKARGLRRLPPSQKRAYERRRFTWKRELLYFSGIFAYVCAFDKGPHGLRICGACAWIALMCLAAVWDDTLTEPHWAGKITAMVGSAGLLTWLLYHMAHTW